MQDTLVKNILKTYGLSTKQEKDDGFKWYFRARRDCRKLALNKSIRLRHAAGVVAAASPNLNWNILLHKLSKGISKE